MSDQLTLNLYANYRYVGGFTTPDVSLIAPLGSLIDVPSYDRFDLRVGVSFEGWEVTAYVDNVLDSLDYRNIHRNSFAPATPASPLYGEPRAPRQVGLIVGKSF